MRDGGLLAGGESALRRSAFSGEGARRVDGRWHRAGSAIVYVSANRALAMLEVLANSSGVDRMHFRRACWSHVRDSLTEYAILMSASRRSRLRTPLS